VTACFRDDLDATLDKPLSLPVGFKNIERQIAEHSTNALNGFNNVRKAEDGRPRGH
jgi:hypothetical protein